MKTTFGFFTLLIAFTGSVHAGELPNSRVEQILAVAGVTHAPSKMLALDIEYRNQAGELLFTLRISEPKIYDEWRKSARAESITGLGQDAFAQPTLKSVCAKTATTAACASALSFGAGPKVSQQQLVALVRAAL